MKKYNRDKRSAYKSNTRKINNSNDDECDGIKRDPANIHIEPRYDGYKQTVYTASSVIRAPRKNKAQEYVNIENAINDIFPEINGGRHARVYAANAPYKKFIPQQTEYTRPKDIEEHAPPTIKTGRTKCIILNDDDEVIYIGIINRTRIADTWRHTIEVTLHNGKKEMRAYERAVDPDRVIHGLTVREIRKYDVEIYYI